MGFDAPKEPAIHFSERLGIATLTRRHCYAGKIVEGDGDLPPSALVLLTLQA